MGVQAPTAPTASLARTSRHRAAALPRLAEAPDALWTRLRALVARGVVDCAAGVTDPTIRVYGLADFSLRPDGGIERTNVGEGGIGCRPATPGEIEQLHRGVDADQAAVLVLARPGYGSGYAARRTLQILHQPRGRWGAR